jgi:hypothetical protein
MAMTTNLPPQAYTRDTLVKAIEWLHTQPQAVRERATSADLLVNIYLQARRRAAVQMEAPVSGETFKADLKHLVEDLKQFEEPSAPPPQAGRSPSSGAYDIGPAHAPVEPLFKHQPVFESVPAHGHVAPMPAHAHSVAAPHPQHQAPAPPPHAPQAQGPKPATWHVDARSLAAAREIQQRFNLSSEGEALRLLITLGQERARDLFP